MINGVMMKAAGGLMALSVLGGGSAAAVGHHNEAIVTALPEYAPGEGERDGVRAILRLGRALMNTIEEETGLERCEILEARTQGQSLDEIITQAGGDTDAVLNSVLDTLAERLAGAVERGRITQSQADQALARGESFLTDFLGREDGRFVERAYERLCTPVTGEDAGE